MEERRRRKGGGEERRKREEKGGERIEGGGGKEEEEEGYKFSNCNKTIASDNVPLLLLPDSAGATPGRRRAANG